MRKIGTKIFIGINDTINSFKRIKDKTQSEFKPDLNQHEHIIELYNIEILSNTQRYYII